jgi:hypothetical protein
MIWLRCGDDYCVRKARMQVKGLVWLGLRTTQFEEMNKLFEDVMGMQRVRDDQEIAGFEIVSRAEGEG